MLVKKGKIKVGKRKEDLKTTEKRGGSRWWHRKTLLTLPSTHQISRYLGNNCLRKDLRTG